MDAKTIGKMVQFHREKKGLLQEELAKLAGVEKKVVFEVEKGMLSVPFDMMLKLFEALDVRLQFSGSLMRLFEEALGEEL